MRIVKGRLRMDNRKEGLKELAGALAAAVIIVAVSKFLTNTVLSGVSDALYKTFCGKAAMTVLVFAAVVILKKMKMYKFSFKLLRAGLLSGLFYVLIGVYRMIGVEIPAVSGTRMLVFIITMLLVGYTEEALFRGLVQNAFHRIFGEQSWQAVWAACICTGILFGAAHLSNIFEPDISVSAAVVQALANVFVGVYFCAMYYRTGKCLWYVVIIHAFNDFGAFLKTGFLAGGSVGASISSTAIPLDGLLRAVPLLALMYLLPALIVLRPKKLQPLLGKVVI